MNEDNDNGQDDKTEASQEPQERPWIVLKTTYDVEAWIDSYNWDLRQAGVKPNASGHGICFRLEHGGEIYLHTDSEGDILLDVTPEAEWVSPLISAATGVDVPAGRIWKLPGNVLTQLVLGLSTLIATSRIVLSHEYNIKKRWY
jgi:hypothetical protein